MVERKNLFVNPTRRGFIGGVAATGVAAILASRTWADGEPKAAAAPAGKPDSVIGGVHIGAITYSYRGGVDTAEYTLGCLLKDGLSETELMDGPIRNFAHIGKGDREAQLAKCVEIRKLYNDAGVNIHIHKFPFGKTDDEIDFNFEVAKALGCKAITTERNDGLAKKLAPFADKHKIWVAFHNHDRNYPKLEEIDPLMNIGDHIGFNLDIGHYVAGTKGKSPIPVLEKYHEKIISLHLKDRNSKGENLPWGQGETPIKEVLQLLKKEKWPIYADIELEYAVPKGSDPVAEVAKCMQYCKEALA